jgi:DNA topoisomerase VI subunit B
MTLDSQQQFPATAPVFHPDESAPGDAIFTKKMRKTPVKQAKLTRIPFHVSRLMEFCSKSELVNQTGHYVYDWPLVVVKELLDNGLDACEEAGIAPVISVEVKGDQIVIADNGPGIPASVIDGVLDYSIRVSSREAYCSPTRGAQGNALKTILPMGYVLDEKAGEDASAVTLIEAHGIAHRVKFSVDHILQEPKITHLTRSSSVTTGTKITVTLPNLLSSYRDTESNLLRIAEAFAWINPHLTLRVVWNGKIKLDFQATNPTWKKWQPSWPTSAHWYDLSRFRRYMAAHIAHRGRITVREFISEFDGTTGTVKQKAVLAETNSSHMSLRKYFGARKANTENIAKLLAAVKAHTRPVKPQALGIIGKDHFFPRMEDAGGDPRTFTYKRALGTAAGIPYVSEFAFGLHRDGLGSGNEPRRRVIRGVNWSAAINDPFRQIGQGGESLDSVLAAVKANTSQPIILALHVAKAHVSYTDRGKSAIVVEGEDNGEEE